MAHINNSLASEKEKTTRLCKGKQAVILLQKGGCIKTSLSSCCIPAPLLILEALLAVLFQLFGLDGAMFKYILPQVVSAMLCGGPVLIFH